MSEELSRDETPQQIQALNAEKADLRDKLDDRDQQIEEFTEEVEHLRETVADLRSELEAKDGQLKQLVATLKQYENPNKPPSQQWPPTDGWGDTDDDDDSDTASSGSSEDEDEDEDEADNEDEDGDGTETGSSQGEGTPGRKPGHEPAWHEFGPPDEIIEAVASACSACGAGLDDEDVFFVEPRHVEDIPDPQPIVTTLFMLPHYDCGECGETTVASHEDCPKEGQYGPNVLAQSALLKIDHRLPYRHVADLFDQLYDLSMAPASAYHATERVARAGRDEYARIRVALRGSDVIYVDETGMGIDGEQGWLWAFTTEEETYYVVAESRSSEVLEAVLADLDAAVVLVSDGWSAYRGYGHPTRQRCWAHLLRKAAFLAARHEEAVPIFRDLWQLFQTLQTVLETDPTADRRRELKEMAAAALEEFVGRDCAEPDVQGLLTTIERGLGHWLTFVERAAVDPTNNRAEQAIRKAVIHRKIMGTLRTERGIFTFETLLSLLVTWDQQDRDVYEELRRTVTPPESEPESAGQPTSKTLSVQAGDAASA